LNVAGTVADILIGQLKPWPPTSTRYAQRAFKAYALWPKL
jgi:hypothetical protein